MSALSGCGGGGPAPAPTAEAAKPAPKAKATKTPPASKTVRVDGDGRKWVGDIPYDVFFDDPLAVASNSAAVASANPGGGGGGMSGGGTPGSNAAVAANPPGPAATPAGPPASGDDWAAFISIEQLQAETKRIRNHLTSSLQSQGTYNGGYAEIQVDGAVLAALANVAAEHPEAVSWKANSRYIRDYGWQLSESSKKLGKEGYTQSQSVAEQIQSVLDGNTPTGSEPEPSRPFSEVANRAGVMKRIEKASEWMRANITNEARFKAENEQILSESTVLGVLAKVAAHEGYESASEDDYKRYAQNLIVGAREANAAAQDQSFPKFQDAINKIQKACAECHANYATGQ